MRALLRRSPGTWVWLFTLTVTTSVVRSTSPALSRELLRQVSTNLFQMGRSAGRVLFLSAFLTGGGGLVGVVVWCVVVSATLERWVGTARWLVVVVAGHVGATLVTTVGIWADVRRHPGATSLVQTIDVGPSYALWAAAGFLAVGLPPVRGRLMATTALVLVLARPFGGPATFTDTGHVAAATIGAAWWLLVPASARTGPLTAPWSRSRPWLASRSSSAPVPAPVPTATRSAPPRTAP